MLARWMRTCKGLPFYTGASRMVLRFHPMLGEFCDEGHELYTTESSDDITDESIYCAYELQISIENRIKRLREICK